MHPEIVELRPKLKEILYDCAVEIKATKAALFLLDTETPRYDLVTEFGFRSTIRQTAGTNDPMVERCSRGRSPFFVNTPGADPKLSELFFQSSSQRMMAVPIFSRGQLVGFIDIRDKTQKQPFDQIDIDKAQSIADRILALVVDKNLWKQRFVTLADSDFVARGADERRESTFPGDNRHSRRAPVAPAKKPAAAAVPPPPGEPPKPRETAQIVAEARSIASRLVGPPSPDTLGAPELAAIRDGLRAILLIPGAVAVVFTAHGMQQVASRGPMTQDALTALNVKLQAWLNKRGESVGALQPALDTPLGPSMPPVTVADLQKIFTAAVNTRVRGLYLTVAFAQPPDKNAHELLSVQLAQLESAIEWSVSRAALQTMRLRVAERLVEPDFTKYPELRKHSFSVADLTDNFTAFLGLAPHEAQTLRLIALVHDCGMRLLDYERLYAKPNLTHDELGLLREHPVVGAAMVEPLLGAEIARAVLCHHERVDGEGYPNNLRGDDIPLAARIVQICEVYTAIVEPVTYQRPERPEDALTVIRRGAGVQFDNELALRFDEMMRARIGKLASR